MTLLDLGRTTCFVTILQAIFLAGCTSHVGNVAYSPPVSPLVAAASSPSITPDEQVLYPALPDVYGSSSSQHDALEHFTLNIVTVATGDRCSGEFSLASGASTAEVPVHCYDGRAGTVRLQANHDRSNANGQISFANSRSRTLKFGTTGYRELTAFIGDPRTTSGVSPLDSTVFVREEARPIVSRGAPNVLYANPRDVARSPNTASAPSYSVPSSTSTVGTSSTTTTRARTSSGSGRCQLPTDRAADGSLCGRRSAQSRAGGR